MSEGGKAQRELRPRVVGIIIARNEEQNIADVIRSLQQQTMPLTAIIVVNDGSTDKTGELARAMGCSVVDLPYHEESYAGRPELAERVNVGLSLAEKYDPDYVLVMGADNILPSDYAEKIIERMEKDPKIVIASGHIEGEPYSELIPRGSGRIIQVSWLRKEFGGLRIPAYWGWEAYLVFRALKSGYKTKRYRDITSRVKRRTGLGKAEYWGKGMYALGYDWRYALGRIFLTFLKSPPAGFRMFWGWFRHEGVERTDVADWVKEFQRREFWKRVWEVLARRGRK